MEPMDLKYRARLIFIVQNYGPVKVDKQVNLKVRVELRTGELATLYMVQEVLR